MSIGGPNYLFDAAASLVRGAEGVKGAITKGGAEVGSAIVRGGVDILAAGPNRAAGLIHAHVEGRELAWREGGGYLILSFECSCLFFACVKTDVAEERKSAIKLY